eukprot:jgi/Hompol1/2258/HPOL_005389-RA
MFGSPSRAIISPLSIFSFTGGDADASETPSVSRNKQLASRLHDVLGELRNESGEDDKDASDKRDADRRSIQSMPNEVLLMIVAHIANRRQSKWSYANLLACTRLDKRWNMVASSYLWKVVDLENQSAFERFYSTISQGSRLRHQYGLFIKSLSMNSIGMKPAQWKCIIETCRNLEQLQIERFYVGMENANSVLTTFISVDHESDDEGDDSDTPPLGEAGVQLESSEQAAIVPGDLLHHPIKVQERAPSLTDIDNEEFQQTVNSLSDGTAKIAIASAKQDQEQAFAVSVRRMLLRFRELIVTDSPRLKLKPLIRLLQRTTKTKRLAISGCNFNEE